MATAAAKAVFEPMKPHRQQSKNQAKQLSEQRAEVSKLRTLVDQLQPLADILMALLEAVLGHPIELKGIQGQHEAQKAARMLIDIM